MIDEQNTHEQLLLHDSVVVPRQELKQHKKATQPWYPHSLQGSTVALIIDRAKLETKIKAMALA